MYLFDPDVAGAPAQVGLPESRQRGRPGPVRYSAVSAHSRRSRAGRRPISKPSNASGVNGDGSDNSLNNAGAAYLFEADAARATYQQTAYLKASNPASGTDNQFGNALAVSGDLLAIAAWQEDGGSPGINGDQTDTSVTRLRRRVRL